MNLDTVASAIGVVPFMSEYNCVLLTDIFLDMMSADELDKLKSICKMKAEGTVLILSMPSYVPKRNAKAWEAIQKRAQKDGSVVKFDKPTDDKLEKYIAKWANQQGKFITRLNAARLIKLCGNDLTRLKNEVDKLCAYTEGEEIQMDAIDLLVAQTLEARIFSLSDQRLTAVLWTMTLLWAAFCFYRRRQQVIQMAGMLQYGGLCYVDGMFYDARGQHLKLTPMQQQLMEMFFHSPSYSLTKAEICDALWPKKSDASETLYTLIRRLKPIVEQHSNLKIEADRGRSYGLTVK